MIGTTIKAEILTSGSNRVRIMENMEESMKKNLTILLSLILTLIIAGPSYAIDIEKMMRDSMGRGYFEASQDNRIQSKKHFRKAFDLAGKLRDWSAMIDAAGGLLALGEREDAAKCFEKIAKMNKKMKDWRACVSLAYSYLSFPKNLVDKDKATQSLEDAKKYASGRKDWRGLVETAKGFYESGSKERALLCLEPAKSIGTEYKNYEAMAEIAYYYKKFDEPDKSQEAAKLSNEYKSQSETIALYPADFKPYGETIAAPKKTDTEIQIAERETTNEEISAKMDYLAKMAEINKKEKDYYAAYDDYYDYPYYHRFYSNYDNVIYLPPDWLCEWSNFHMRHYNLINGGYVFLGW